MVMVQQCVSPSFEDLRPVEIDQQKTKMKDPAGQGVFPVHKNLIEHLVKNVDSDNPDEVIAHTLAVCATYAYSELSTFADMVTRLGLENSRCLSVTFANDPLFVDSTAFVVQAKNVVIVAYRGTEPLSLINWLTDTEAGPERVPLDIGPQGNSQSFGAVHPGFYRNVRATRYKIGQALLRARDGDSILDPPSDQGTEDRTQREEHARLKALYLTGHSLGGAMAALMGALLDLEPDYAGAFDSIPRAVYTFGQPMVGTPEFASSCKKIDRINNRLFRYVYEGDPVPSLPSHDTGDWSHYGRQIQYATRLRIDKVADDIKVLGIDIPKLKTQKIAHDFSALRDEMGKALVSGQWEGRPTSSVGQMRWITTLPAAFGSFPLSQLLMTRNLPFLYRMDDHRPHHYVSMLSKRGQTTEFGDHEYAYDLPIAHRIIRALEQQLRDITQVRGLPKLIPSFPGLDRLTWPL